MDCLGINFSYALQMKQLGSSFSLSGLVGVRCSDRCWGHKSELDGKDLVLFGTSFNKEWAHLLVPGRRGAFSFSLKEKKLLIFTHPPKMSIS